MLKYQYGGPIAGGTWTTYGWGNVSYAVKCPSNPILATEFHSVSDQRCKSSVTSLELDRCMKFVRDVSPVEYVFTKTNQPSVGYIAQDVLRQGFPVLLSVSENKELEETTDDDGLVSPKGISFVMDYDRVAALLHVVLRRAVERIDALETKVARIDALEATVARLAAQLGAQRNGGPSTQPTSV